LPAVASLKELEQVQLMLEIIKAEYPDAYEKFKMLFKTHRQVGYKNIAKMILGESTPKKLKGLE